MPAQPDEDAAGTATRLCAARGSRLPRRPLRHRQVRAWMPGNMKSRGIPTKTPPISGKFGVFQLNNLQSRIAGDSRGYHQVNSAAQARPARRAGCRTGEPRRSDGRFEACRKAVRSKGNHRRNEPQKFAVKKIEARLVRSRPNSRPRNGTRDGEVPVGKMSTPPRQLRRCPHRREFWLRRESPRTFHTLPAPTALPPATPRALSICKSGGDSAR